MFPSDAAAEPFKSDSQGRGKKTTKARGQTDENQGSRDGFSTREGGREARTGRRDNHRLEKQKVLNTALQAGITNRSF